MPPSGRLMSALAQRKLLALFEALDELGLVEPMMKDSLSISEIAEKANLSRDQALLLLRTLVLNQLVERVDERWRIHHDVLTDLHAGTHDTWLPLLRIERWAHNAHLNGAGIVNALRGSTQDSRIPSNLVDDLADAMTAGAAGSAPQLARLPELRSARHLADLAGGSGVYSVMLARLSTTFEATVYDRPAMLPHAERNAIAAGVSERVHTQSWDLLQHAIPTETHDAILLSHALHLLTAGQRAALLRRARDALSPHGSLVIHDFTYDVTADHEDNTVVSSIDWLAAGTGFVLSDAELAREITSAGFVIKRLISLLGTGSTMIVAKRS